MRSEVRASVVQLESRLFEPEINRERMADWVEQEAVEHQADLIVFPELASTGYLPVDVDDGVRRQLLAAAEPIPGPTTDRLGELAARLDVHVVVGIPQMHPQVPHTLYNSVALIEPSGTVGGVYQKTHLPFDEKDCFARGSQASVFDTELGRIAMNVCYDVRFPELARCQALAGAEILVSSWAMFEQPGKAPDDSMTFRCRARATENFIHVLGCNHSGASGGRRYVGGSVAIAPSGAVLAASRTDQEEAVRAVLTHEALEAQRAYLPIYADRRPELYGRIVEAV